MRVWCIDTRRADEPFYIAAHGVRVVGSLFRRSSEPSAHTPAVLTPSEAAQIVVTGARRLVAHYWGRYVAFVRDPVRGTTWILRDPAGGLRCLYTRLDGVHLYFSHIDDCLLAAAPSFSVNWDYIAVHLVVPTVAGAVTAICEVRELCGGQCDEIAGNVVRTLDYWSPCAIAQGDILEDPTEAAALLRRTTRTCLHALAAQYPRILHLLSGGVDSSIVLAALATAPSRPSLTCFTLYSPEDATADERVFAGLAAHAAGCRSLTRIHEEQQSLSIVLEGARAVRPDVYLACLNERAILDVALEADAHAITNGVGGDALFYEATEHAVSDHLLRRGVTRALATVVADSARLTETSVWRVLRGGLEALSRRARVDALAPYLAHRLLLTREARERLYQAFPALTSPWLRGLEHLPPGKQAHIRMIAQPTVVERPLRRWADPDEFAPLASQPILEVCLRIPTDVLLTGGHTRAIARAAFSGDVPAQILARRDKGMTMGLAERVLRRNRALARELLPVGLLVQHGLLDRERLLLALSEAPSEVSPTEVLCHLSTELWARIWSS